jgi:hypothetical protein
MKSAAIPMTVALRREHDRSLVRVHISEALSRCRPISKTALITPPKRGQEASDLAFKTPFSIATLSSYFFRAVLPSISVLLEEKIPVLDGAKNSHLEEPTAH